MHSCQLWIIIVVIIECILCTESVDNNGGLDRPGCDGRVYNNICYYVSSTEATWKDAVGACFRDDGRLASITSPLIDSLVASVMQVAPVSVAWVGARREQEYWTWVNSEEFLLRQGCYADDYSEPDMDITLEMTSRMSPGTCMTACEEKEYPLAGLQNGTACSCSNSFGRYGTDDACTRPCSDLVEGEDQRCGGKHKNFIYRIQGGYGVWGYNQPNNFGGNQRCGVIHTWLRPLNKLADEICTKRFTYLCTTSTDNCRRNDAHFYKNRCYIYGKSSTDWFNARQTCRRYGGDLLEITDQQTDLDIAGLIKELKLDRGSHKIWIGLYKGTWSWRDDSSMIYSNWARDNPDLNSDACVVLSASKGYRWDDEGCDQENHYICEKPLPGFSLKIASKPETTSSVPTSIVPRKFSPTVKDRIISRTDGERPERKNDGKKRRIKIERKTTARTKKERVPTTVAMTTQSTTRRRTTPSTTTLTPTLPTTTQRASRTIASTRRPPKRTRPPRTTEVTHVKKEDTARHLDRPTRHPKNRRDRITTTAPKPKPTTTYTSKTTHQTTAETLPKITARTTARTTTRPTARTTTRTTATTTTRATVTGTSQRVPKNNQVIDIDLNKEREDFVEHPDHRGPSDLLDHPHDHPSEFDHHEYKLTIVRNETVSSNKSKPVEKSNTNIQIITAESEKRPFEEFIFVASIGNEMAHENETQGHLDDGELQRSDVELLEIERDDSVMNEVFNGKNKKMKSEQSKGALGKFKTSIIVLICVLGIAALAAIIVVTGLLYRKRKRSNTVLYDLRQRDYTTRSGGVVSTIGGSTCNGSVYESIRGVHRHSGKKLGVARIPPDGVSHGGGTFVETSCDNVNNESIVTKEQIETKLNDIKQVY